ncbi:MAG: transcription termination/antitermination NusG family protein [Planctomycetota bacterium]
MSAALVEPEAVPIDHCVIDAVINPDPALAGSFVDLAARDRFAVDPAGDRRWMILHTRPQQERRLAHDLSARGIDFFLPLTPRRKALPPSRRSKVGGRSHVLRQEPTFPGYVFLFGDPDASYHADRTRRVANILQVPDQDVLQNELAQLRRAMTAGSPMDPFPYLKKGVRVQVCGGPLRGLVGKVESRDRLDQIVLGVNMLGDAVRLKVDAMLVDILDD